jgi:hypothetical protein
MDISFPAIERRLRPRHATSRSRGSAPLNADEHGVIVDCRLTEYEASHFEWKAYNEVQSQTQSMIANLEISLRD